MLRLFRSGYARGTFIQEIDVVLTETRGVTVHRPGLAQLHGKKVNEIWSAEDAIRHTLNRTIQDATKAKRAARELVELLPVGILNDGTAKGPDFSAQFINELRRAPDLLDHARIVLDTYLPEQDSRRITRFRVHELEAERFFIDTDINWSAAVRDYRRLQGDPKATFGEASILAQIHSGFIDLGLAARFGSELLTSELQERLVTHRVRQIMQARMRSDEEISAFNQKALGRAFALRSAINSKMRSFSDFLDVMDKARKFKEMLQKANPDVGLVQTYADEVKKGTWLDGLAPKSVRFGVFTLGGAALDLFMGTGLTTTMAGVGLAGFDQFVVDKLVRGWRPNTFIENELRPLVYSKSDEI